MTNHHPPTALTGGPPPIFSLFCEHVVFERKNQKTLEPPLISVRLGYYNVLLVLQAPASAAHSLHAPPLPLPSRSPAQPQPRAQPLPSFSSAAAATSARTASGRRSTRPSRARSRCRRTAAVLRLPGSPVRCCRLLLRRPLRCCSRLLRRRRRLLCQSSELIVYSSLQQQTD